jgi:hypothetical protein
LTKKEEARVLEELMSSNGWGILQRKMQDEILTAAYQLAENKQLSVDEINFRRGAMWAARRMIELPTNMKMLIDNELLMEAATEAEIKKQ